MPDMLMKTKAISEAMAETGFGRRVVENKMAELETRGLIHITPSPADKRVLLISRTDLELVIRSLKGENIPG